MNKLGLTLLMLLALSPAAFGQQECDCTITPYKPNPPCWEYCTSKKVLATATVEELQFVVGVEEQTAKRIVDWGGRANAASLDDYKEQNVLTDEQVKKLKKRLENLNKKQVNYFEKSPAERANVQRELRILYTLSSTNDAPTRNDASRPDLQKEVAKPGPATKPAPETSRKPR